jgi:hypothetical protein
MKVSTRLGMYGVVLASLLMSLSGCVVHDREVVHHDSDRSASASYEEGYQEGYYDREHHRYWHDKAWHDCIENDIHCPR